jgi:hypothetical protein
MFDTKTPSTVATFGGFKNKRQKGSWRLKSLYEPHEFLLAVKKVECCFTVQIF